MSTSPTDVLRHEPRTTAGPFAVNDTCFVVESNRAEMAAVLGERLRDLRAEPSPGPVVVLTVDHRGPAWHPRPWGVWRDGTPCAQLLAPSDVLTYLLWETTRLVLENVGSAVPIRAGAVTLGDKAVLVAGRPLGPRSRLTGWLATKGWGFLTDEVAIVDTTDGQTVLRPCWLPLAVRRTGPLEQLVPDGETGDPVFLPASSLGELAPATSLAAVVLPAHHPGEDPEPRRLTPGETLAALTERLPLLGEQGRRSFLTLAPVAESVPGFSVAVDDLDVAETHLRTVVGALS